MKSRTTTKTDPILIYEDKTLLNNFINRGQLLFPLVKNLKTAYEELEMPGVFNNDVYKKLISEPWEIEKAYNLYLEEEISASGLRNTILRAAILVNTKDALNRLKSVLGELVEKSKGYLLSDSDFPLKAIVIDDGEPVLTKESQELILESQCRVYLNTDEEKAVYDKLQNLKSSYNELIESFDTVGFRPYFQGLESLSVYLSESSDKSIDVKPDAVSIIAAYAENRNRL